MKTPVRPAIVVVCLLIAAVGNISRQPEPQAPAKERLNDTKLQSPAPRASTNPHRSEARPKTGENRSTNSTLNQESAIVVDSTTRSTKGEEVFQQFDRWIEDFFVDASTDQSARVSEGEALAKARRSILEKRIESDPEGALQHAVPMNQRKLLPATITQHLEERVSGLARFEVLAAVAAPGEVSPATPIRRFVTIGDRTYNAYVYGRRSLQPSKESIPIHGIAVGNSLAVHESAVRTLDRGESPDPSLPVGNPDGHCPISGNAASPSVAVETGGTIVYLCHAGHIEPLARAFEADESGIAPMVSTATAVPGASAWTLGPKTVLFMRINFPDDLTESISESEAYEMMRHVNDFFVENSYGTTSLAATVTPLLTMPFPTTAYPGDDTCRALLAHARQAAVAAGFDPESFDLDCVHLRRQFSSSFALVGTKGAWLQSRDPSVACHELGHNYGLWHANAWRTSDGSTIGDGVNEEYANPFDRMGNGTEGDCQFNLCHKYLLRWLPDHAIQTVTTDGVYRIDRFNVPALVDGRTYALKIRKDDTKDYWIETRPLIAGDPDSLNSIHINWSPWAGSMGGTQLLDTTPGSEGWRYDAPLVAGRSFYDGALGLKITPRIPADGSRGSIDVSITHVHRLLIEAETGTLPSSTQIVPDFLASGSQCIASPASGQCDATFTLEIPADGDYRIWCRVLTSSANSIPVSIAVDGGAGAFDRLTVAGGTGAWQWTLLGPQSDGTFANQSSTAFPLSTGTHSVHLNIADRSAMLDCVLVTDDPSTNPPPVLSAIADQIMISTSGSTSIPFTVAGVGRSQSIQKLTATSSNPAVVPASGILFSGSGDVRMVTIIPTPNRLGQTSITITAVDRNGSSVSQTFALTVVGPIQSRVNAARAGDTVFVPPGIHLDRLVIDKDLILEGAGAVTAIIDGGLSGVPLTIVGGANVIVRNLTLRNGSRGGLRNNGVVTLEYCIIRDNQSSDCGGVWNGATASLILEGCTINSNRCRSSYGGGIFNAGTAILRACTVSGNRAADKDDSGGGGGIYNSGFVELHHCTITQNLAADHGGGIANAGTAILRSTIVAANTVQRGHGPDCYGTITSHGYNLIQDPGGFVLAGDGTDDLFALNPMLGPLQDNGGPTPTHELMPGSPAIDHAQTGDRAVDQRGIRLPVDVAEVPNAGDGSDIGAYEWIPENFRRLEAIVTKGPDAGTLTVRIVLACRGDENLIQVELNLPPAVVRIRDAVPGSDSRDATVSYSVGPNSPGQLSSMVTLSAGRAFEAGTHELAVFNLECDSEVSGQSEGELEIIAASILGVDGASLPVACKVSFATATPTPRLSIGCIPGGDILVRLAGGEGYDWEIQASPDFVTWHTVATIMNAASNTEVVDPMSRLYSFCFYRVVVGSNRP